MNARLAVSAVVWSLALVALRAQEAELTTILVRDDGVALATLLRERPAMRDGKIEGGWPPLNVAAARGSIACVRELLAAKAPIDATDANARTAIQRAADGGHGAVVRLLRDYGAPLDLLTAMVADDETWVRRWLADNTDEVPWPTQMRAAQAGATATLRLALPRAAPRPQVELGGAMPSLAFFAVAHPATLAMLLDAGEPIDQRFEGKWGFTGSTLLHAAAQRDAGASIDVLLARGMNVDEPDQHGGTALQAAAAGASVQAMATLLGKGASLAKGPTLLQFTCEYLARGTEELVRRQRQRAAKLLLQHGVPLDAFAALTLGMHEELARFLTADPQLAKAPRKEPLLVRAAMCTDVVALRLLLDAGADIAVTGDDGYTALHWAVFWNAPECVELLLARGAPVSPSAKNGLTPLHEAVRCSHPDQAARMLRAGADRTKKDREGKVPLDYAVTELRAKFEAVFAAPY